MEIKYLPSFVENYEFIICYKPYPDLDDAFEYFGVEENGFNAEKFCLDLNALGIEAIIIHNIKIQGRKK